ncbi:bifunctional nitrate reductase/sulfite reductase flavoprotein subunit alpha [Hoyosella altamirensis]|uniref:assimilatory sulfite reductase (NADPH) n=1 Tax=Hoyosella altamirensis TaxID=616997 RepID=A0A839RJC7_9ACTN|nr:bifunctional nitrate reductase/sulfite reductase flavoprotein subunit alpha [Hoyosella altamirensis]MBB3036389.1 NADPH-dependent sulfite reductase flavoprotein alpha-component [Hoyosella altamirensis]
MNSQATGDVTVSGKSTGQSTAVCSYCGVGCGIKLDTAINPSSKQLAITKVSGDKNHPANSGRLCTKGSTHADMMAAPGRMTSAYLRPGRGESLVPTALDAAISEAATRLRQLIDTHGPDAVGLYVSGQMSIEAQYLANKLAKGYLRTVHIESNSRLCMASAGTGYKQSLGADGPPGSYDDFDHADLFFAIGANMADCHPILFLRMADRLKRGAKLIVADPRRTATAQKADLFLQLKPGTDLALLNGLLHLLVENGDIDEEFIAEHTDGWDAMPEFLTDYTPDKVAEITGLSEADIRTAATWIGEAGNWMTLWTMGLNQSTHGTWNTNAICNLHLATGAICKPGSGPFSLTGQPNAMGGREMGYMGPGLPGQRAVFSADDRTFVEKQWGLDPGTIRDESGTGTIDMFRQMADGTIKAVWIICTNPVASIANRKTVIAGLEKAELVIAQDVFTENATNAYADILLPAALWVESDGVMVNSERNLTLVQKAVDAPGDALPDWQLICRVAQALGFTDGFRYASSEDVFNEIRQFSNPQTGYDLRGATYERLRETTLQWPCPPADGHEEASPRNPIRYLNDGVSQHLHITEDGEQPRLAFATASRKANFFPRPHMDPAEMPDDDFPWILNTGRLQHQWHTMTKTGKVAKLNELNPSPFIEVHPDDAKAHGIANGDKVEATSRRGRVVLPAVVTDRVRPGTSFAPFHWNDEHGEYVTVNALTSDAVDSASLQPELKFCAVSLRRISEAGQDAPAAETQDSNRPASSLAELAGLGSLTPPAPNTAEQTYLAGFFAALNAAPVEAATVPVLPSTAPVSPTVRLWIDGLLAGTYSRVPGPASGGNVQPTADADDEAVTVLWASQTGNAEDFAAQCAAELEKNGHRARTVSMDEFSSADLANVSKLLVITSTFGDGEPPDNGSSFWEELQSDNAPALEGLRYAVLAMGDSNYDNFCGHGRNIDSRLKQLGAAPLVTRVDCEPEYHETAQQWLQNILASLKGDAGPDQDAPVPAPKTATNSAVVRAEPFTRDKPTPAPLVTNTLLSRTGSEKEVRQFGFSLADAAVSYQAGDALGVVSRNSNALIGEWLEATGLKSGHTVTIDDKEMPLHDALRKHLDISRVTPALLKFLHERSGDKTLAKVTRPGNRIELDRFLWGKQAVDVIREFPVSADVIEWLDVLKRLQPRLYSISSSPKVSPDEVQLTVSVVRYENEFGRERGGVCSTFLADRCADTTVPLYLQRSAHFRPPNDPDTPMIMIGPGTGIAPFRAFLQDRRADGHGGKNWLFFGEQKSATDFYYQDELEDMFRDGFLTRLDLAFSRDQRQKIYVQDRMLEHGAELWRWINEGAHIYVCGDASRMAKDVDDTLTTIARSHGHMTEADALAFKKRLSTEKRYVRDVY